MGRSYSLDLRSRVVAFVEAGHSRRAAARHFGVSESFAITLMRRVARSGSPAPGRLEPYAGFLVATIERDPDITMPELRAISVAGARVTADPAVLSRFLGRRGFTYKKTLMAAERDRSDIRAARDTWIARRQPKMRDEPHRLMFVDETAVTTKLTRLRGRSRRGTHLPSAAPFGHWTAQTFIAGLRGHELTAPWTAPPSISGSRRSAPTLQRGDVVILDNLQLHKSAKAADILKDKGAWFLFLPAYAPDLNPIEMAFAKLKAHLRNAKARTFDTLWKAVGAICDLFTPIECWNSLQHAQYLQN